MMNGEKIPEMTDNRGSQQKEKENMVRLKSM